jgi:RimJ/RimL family protein N-acetyltransferase
MSALVLPLPGGRAIHVRPVQPGDKPAILDAFARLGPEGRLGRFFAPIRRLSARQLAFFTEIDHHDHEALIATAWPGGDVVGVARYIRMADGETAEFAIAIVEGWQRRGAGGALLDLLVARARAEGVARIFAVHLPGNAAVPALLRRYGPPARRLDGGLVEEVVEILPPKVGSTTVHFL